MFNNILRIAAICLVACGASTGIRAAECQTAFVNTLSSTTCTVRDMTFQFGVTADDPLNQDLILTPDTLSPAGTAGFFILAEDFSEPGSLLGNDEEIVTFLPFTVSITDPSAGEILTGMTIISTNAAASGTGAYALAQNTVFTDCGLAVYMVRAGAVAGGSEPSSQSSILNDNDFCPVTSPTQASSESQFLISNGSASGAASIQGFELYFSDGVPATGSGGAGSGGNTVPEPSSLLLLVSALTGIGGFARRRREAAPGSCSAESTERIR